MTVGNEVFFHADARKGTGWELWKTDGTAAGTVLVKDINPGPGGSNRTLTGQRKAAVGKTLFLTADDGKTGLELWKSDGTTAGTVLVKDINPGSATGVGSSALTVVGNSVYFYGDDGKTGFELWKSDGTTAGTVMVKDVNPGPAGAFSSSQAFGGETPNFFAKQIIGFGNGVIFTASDGKSGIELWKTDGTAKGTVQVKDIEPGAGNSDPGVFRRFGSRFVFFLATTGLHGTELWRTDGTAAGTVIVADIQPGNGSGIGGDAELVGALQLANGKVLVSANDGVHGEELWSISIGATAQQVGFTARLGIYWSEGSWPVKSGAGCSKNGFSPELNGTDPVLGKTVSLSVSGADSKQRGFLAIGLTSGPTILPPHCVLWVNLGGAIPAVLLPFATDASGNYTLGPLKVPNNAGLIGALFGTQAVIAGPNGLPSLGFALTNGLWLAPGF